LSCHSIYGIWLLGLWYLQTFLNQVSYRETLKNNTDRSPLTQKPWVNSGAPEGWAVPVQLVAPVVRVFVSYDRYATYFVLYQNHSGSAPFLFLLIQYRFIWWLHLFLPVVIG
jgi:hypothetical protein